MKSLKGFRLIVFLLLLAQSALAQQMYMQVEVRRPAVLRVRSDVQRLLVVNNTKPATNGARECLFAATQTLEEGGRFEDVSLLPEALLVSSSSNEDTKDSLLERYDVDALLMLDALIIFDITSSEQVGDGSWDAWFETHSLSRWTIYYPNASAVSFTTTDTLLWEQNDVSKAQALAALPDRTETLLDVAAYMGEQVGQRMTPQWETEDRYFYLNEDPRLTAGIEAVQLRDWATAATRWQELYNTLSTSPNQGQAEVRETIAYAAADIAVAMEMQDLYDEAIAWTKKAQIAFRRLRSADAAQQVVNLQYYLTQLQLRQSYTF